MKCDTLRGLEQLRSQPNETRIPQLFKIQISNSPIAFKLYTEVKNLKLHKKLSMTRMFYIQTAFADDTCNPQIFKCNILISNGPIAFKFYTLAVAVAQR